MRTVRASFFGFPARRRRWERALRTGLWREATRAAMLSPSVIGDEKVPVTGFQFFLRSGGADLQPSHHKVQEMASAFKIQRGRQGADVIEKRAPRSELCPQQPIRPVGDLPQRMQTASQQVHRGQQRGEALLALSEVVFQVVARGLESIRAFIFDLSACACRRDQPDNVLFPNLPAGDQSCGMMNSGRRGTASLWEGLTMTGVMAL
jgi:hypothetical protein